MARPTSAGIDVGDIVLAVDGERVTDQADVLPADVAARAGRHRGLAHGSCKDGDVREIRVRSIDRMEVLRKPVGV